MSSSTTFPSLHIPEHLYFITATICGWKTLFNCSTYADLVMKSLEWHREQGRMLLFAYILMSTHLHMLVKPLDRTIGELVQGFGSYTAHAILNQLQKDNNTRLVNYFQKQKRDKRHQHSVWQDIQAVNVFSNPFLAQKLEYIHQNPLVKGNNPEENRADFRYSSANFYDNGGPIPVMVDDIREYL
jgi:REP element-mobilizing transposase RayT